MRVQQLVPELQRVLQPENRAKLVSALERGCFVEPTEEQALLLKRLGRMQLSKTGDVAIGLLEEENSYLLSGEPTQTCVPCRFASALNRMRTLCLLLSFSSSPDYLLTTPSMPAMVSLTPRWQSTID